MSDVLRDLVSKATPGPWRTGENHWTLTIPCVQAGPLDDPRLVCEIGVLEPGNVLADARLIALAPDLALLVADMADALTSIAEYVGCWNPDECGGRIGTCRVCASRALLVRVDRLTEER